MLLVFNRGGPGSYRSSRERRGKISQIETQFYSKAQQIPRSFNQHFFQNNRVGSKPTLKTSPTRLLRPRSMMSSRRNTLLSFI